VVCPNGESDEVSVTKEICVVGINDNKIVRFNIYPNPAGNELRITNYGMGLLRFMMFLVKKYYLIILSPRHLII